MVVRNPQTPDRTYIAEMARGDYRMTIALEGLFQRVNDIAGTDLTELQTQANITDALAQVALNRPIERGDQGARPYARLSMQDNTTATVIDTIDTPVKVAGATSGISESFTLTDNRATLEGQGGNYLCSATVRISGSSGNVVELFIAVNGVVSLGMPVTLDGGAATVTVQDIVSINPQQFVELWVSNTSSTDDVTMSHMNFIARRP